MPRNNAAAVEPESGVQSKDRHGPHAQSFWQSENRADFASRRFAPLNSNCIVCGAQNANGLQLTFETRSNGVRARWAPKTGWESFQGTVHGGIITAVLDEAMSKAIIASGWEAFTVELRVRFHHRVSPGEELYVRGWVVERHKRRILAEACLTAETGRERAHAWGAFLVPPGETAL
jgi:acyl-coenzyme A thioesterase PaaI-like protein